VGAAALVIIGKYPQTGWEYVSIAWHLVRGKGYTIRQDYLYPNDPPTMPTQWMMPFYPFLLTGAELVTPDSPLPLYVLQSILAGATAYVLFRLGSGVYGTRAALFSTGLFCFYPTFVYSSVVPHPLCWEFAALLLALSACRAFLARRSMADLTGCALATLWAIYIRPAWIVLVPVVILLWRLAGGGWKPYRRGILLFCLVITVGISPWVARNYIELGSVSLTSTAYPFWIGHNSLGHATGYGPAGRRVASVRAFHPRLAKELDAVKHQGEVAIMKVFRRAAFEAIRERPLLQMLVLPAKRVLYFLFWDPHHPKTQSWLLYRLPYLMLLVSAVFGLVMSWRSPGASSRFGWHCVLGVWLAGSLTVAVFHYLPRFRMPAELLLMLPSGYFLDRMISAIGSRRAERVQHSP